MSVRVVLIGGPSDGTVYDASDDRPPPCIHAVGLDSSWTDRIARGESLRDVPAVLEDRLTYLPIVAEDGRYSVDDLGRYRYLISGASL